MPDHLRTDRTEGFREAARVSFSPDYRPPTLPWLPRPPVQLTDFRPSSIDDILEPEALRLVKNWARSCGLDLMRMGREGPSSTRRFHQKLAIGQSLFRPPARGIVWDLRRQHEGVIVPLAFDAPSASTLDFSRFQDALATYPDQEAVGFLLEGIQFKAPLSLELVLLPHLLDLAKGVSRVDAELHRLTDVGYYAVFDQLPFVPCRCVPNGTVERKLEPDRPRRKEDQGRPRSLLPVRGEDTCASVLNEAIGLHDLLPDGTRKWPLEVKPRPEDVMRDLVVLRAAAHAVDQSVLVFADDFKDFYNQFALAPSELWKVVLFWLPRSAGSSSPNYSFLVSLSLGFGITAASNVARRFAYIFLYLVRLEMERLEATSVLSPAERAWVASRQRFFPNDPRQWRLWTAHQYTDDPFFAAVGHQRLVRLLCSWRKVTRGARFRMAIAAQRSAGVAISWLGL